MAIVNGYTTLAAVKARQSIRDTAEDEHIKTIITAVSRLIDDYCGRRFYASASSVVRYYTADALDCLLVDDLLSVTSLKTDLTGDLTYEDTWATTDYLLRPANNPADGMPYWMLERTVFGGYWFPRHVPNGVQVTGSWGFASTTPPLIAEAAIAQVGFHMRAPDIALTNTNPGIALEQVRGVGLHPWVRRMLASYVRVAVG